MQRKLIYIFFAATILVTSSGFGFLESSTIMHGRVNRQMKSDSLKISMQNVPFSKNTSPLKKEVEKPSENTIAKSVVQWVAVGVKNTFQKITTSAVEAVKRFIGKFMNSSLSGSVTNIMLD